MPEYLKAQRTKGHVLMCKSSFREYQIDRLMVKAARVAKNAVVQHMDNFLHHIEDPLKKEIVTMHLENIALQVSGKIAVQPRCTQMGDLNIFVATQSAIIDCKAVVNGLFLLQHDEFCKVEKFTKEVAMRVAMDVLIVMTPVGYVDLPMASIVNDMVYQFIDSKKKNTKLFSNKPVVGF